MAATTCTRAGLTEVGACLSRFSNHEKKALLAYQLVIWCNGLANTSYGFTASEIKTLSEAAKAVTGGMTQAQLETAFLSILWASVDGGWGFVAISGISQNATPAEASLQISCLKNLTDQQLDEINVFLFCTILSSQQQIA